MDPVEARILDVLADSLVCIAIVHIHNNHSSPIMEHNHAKHITVVFFCDYGEVQVCFMGSNQSGPQV